MTRLVQGLLGLALIAGAAQAAPDPWEGTPLTNAEEEACHPVADDLVFPVPNERRPSARDLLTDRQFAPLSRAQVADLLNRDDVGPRNVPAKPYLIRAIAGFEETGRFYVSVCADVLEVNHGSLGRTTPTPLHVPLIVFLDRPPVRVHALWEVVE